MVQTYGSGQTLPPLLSKWYYRSKSPSKSRHLDPCYFLFPLSSFQLSHAHERTYRGKPMKSISLHQKIFQPTSFFFSMFGELVQVTFIMPLRKRIDLHHQDYESITPCREVSEVSGQAIQTNSSNPQEVDIFGDQIGCTPPRKLGFESHVPQIEMIHLLANPYRGTFAQFKSYIDESQCSPLEAFMYQVATMLKSLMEQHNISLNLITKQVKRLVSFIRALIVAKLAHLTFGEGKSIYQILQYEKVRILEKSNF